MAKAIFLEGTDGTGKSTQLKLLKEYLEAKGETVITFREPGGSAYYEALREFYLNAPYDHPPISDALLSAAGRAANIIATKKALAAGKWVLSDRAYLSSYVYQSVQGVPLKDIEMINTYALRDFNYDIKIVLDAPVGVSSRRVAAATAKKDYWESLGNDFFEKVRRIYIELAATEGCVIVDASKSIEDIHTEIVRAVEAGS